MCGFPLPPAVDLSQLVLEPSAIPSVTDSTSLVTLSLEGLSTGDVLSLIPAQSSDCSSEVCGGTPACLVLEHEL